MGSPIAGLYCVFSLPYNESYVILDVVCIYRALERSKGPQPAHKQPDGQEA